MRINNLVYPVYANKCISSKGVSQNIKYHQNIQQNTNLMQAPLNIGSYGITFGYNNVIKDLFREDKLPEVRFGIYGDRLTKENVSLEHLRPYSKSGKSKLSNFALASKQKNNIRGNEDIRKFLTPEMAKNYLKQFVGIETVSKSGTKFNGNNYIDMIISTLKGLGVDMDSVSNSIKKSI